MFLTGRAAGSLATHHLVHLLFVLCRRYLDIFVDQLNGILWRSREPKKVGHAGVAFVFGVVFSEGVESSKKEDGRNDNGKVDYELFQSEFIILSLENILVEGVEEFLSSLVSTSQAVCWPSCARMLSTAGSKKVIGTSLFSISMILARESCRIFGNSWTTFCISSSFSVPMNFNAQRKNYFENSLTSFKFVPNTSQESGYSYCYES